MKSMVLPLSVCVVMIVGLFAQNSTTRPRDLKEEVDKVFPRVVETRRKIHQNPELSNEEKQTAELVATRLRELGLEVQTGVAGHGVIGLLKGKRDGRCVAVRADMDALPITETKVSEYQSKKPGVMHACGHDAHVAIALGVAEILAKQRDELSGSVKFIFQPAEEGMPLEFKGDWGAKLMVAAGVLQNPKPEAIFALHCSPRATVVQTDGHSKGDAFEVGKYGYCIGPASALSDRFNIVIRGKMAHGSTPEQGTDAIVIAAEAITALQTIRSRQIDTMEPLVITVGTIQGGQRANILADKVELTGTVRTHYASVRDKVVESMHRTLKGVTEAHGATYEMTYREGYPAIHNPAALAERCVATLKRVGGDGNVLPVMAGMGGEDFSYFTQQIPGFFYRIGTANVARGIVASGHTPDFDIDEESLKHGVISMTALVQDFLAEGR